MQGKRDDHFKHGIQRVELAEYQKKTREMKIDRDSMNQLIMNYLQVEGFKDAAAAFKEEAGVGSGNLESITERVDVRKYLQDGEVQNAKKKVETHFPDVMKDKELAFRFNLQELLELIRSGDAEGALKYATESMSSQDLSSQNLELMEEALCLLAFDDPAQCKYFRLLSPSQRAETASYVNSAILRSCSQDPTPQLKLIMRLLYWIESKLQQDIHHTGQMESYGSQFNGVVNILQQIKELVTPYTDSVTDITRKLDVNIARVTEQPVLDIMIAGHGICGKSQLVDVLLGQTIVGGLHLSCDLVVKKGISKMALLKGADGKTLAVEADGVRNWLTDYKPTGTEKDEVDKSLCLEATACFLSDGLANLHVNLVDTKRDTAVASAKNGYFTYNGDAFVFLINYEHLKTDREAEILEPFSNPLLRNAPSENFVFVVTNAARFFATHLRIVNMHAKEEGVELFTSLSDLTNYVLDMIKPVFAKVKKQQISVLYTELAHYARIVHSDKDGTPLEVIYDYCEMGYGSGYMQTIDAIPEGELRRTAALHAGNQIKDSGLEHFEQGLCTVAYNGVPLFLLSICTDVEHTLKRFTDLLEANIHVLDHQREVTENEQKVLTQQHRFVETRLGQVRHVISLMRSELQGVISDTIDSFWSARLNDLTGVMLEDRKLETFKSRQEVSVNELIGKVGEFKTFINTRYLRDKRYLLDSLANDKPAEWEFLGDNKGHILDVIEKHCADYVLDIGQVFTHFIKDELELLLPRVSELCMQRRDELLTTLHRNLSDLLAATEAHTHVALDIDNLCDEWLETGILIPDERNLNNFIRELPFEVSDVVSKTLLPSLNVTKLTDDACNAKVCGYVVTAWTEVLRSKDTFSMVSFNKEVVTRCLDNLEKQIVDYVGTYVTALFEGVQTLTSDIVDIDAHHHEVITQLEAVGPLLQSTVSLSSYLRESVNWEYHSAHAVAQEMAMKKSDELNAEEAA